MSLEDPFFVVKEEVCKALNRTRALYQRWLELQHDGVSFGRDELDWTATELKNALKSIEWDLEDLEDTIAIVEKNPARFRLDAGEVIQRRFFIQQTRDEVKEVKERMNIRGRDVDHTARQPLLEGNSSPTHVVTMTSSVRGGYSRLKNAPESFSPTHNGRTMGLMDDDEETKGRSQILSQQVLLVDKQDDQLRLISGSVGTLKTMSQHIGHELSEQALMLDDLGHDLENTETKLDATLRKVAKVLHMSSDRRQWMAIGVLSALMILVIILFFVL